MRISHQMNDAAARGSSFGLTSGVITTLGLVVGLHAGTHSRLAVVGGIVTIAVADSFSDAFGMHVSQEAGLETTRHKLWFAAAFVLATKFILAISFLIPVLLLDFARAAAASIVWGFAILGIVSYLLARRRNEKPWKAIVEHFAIAGLVVVLNHAVGLLIAQLQL